MHNTLKLLCLLFLISIVSCTKDDVIVDDTDVALSQEAKNTTRKITSDEIPHIIEYLKERTNGTMRFEIQSYISDTRSVEPDLILGETQMDEILESVNNYSRKNFTFKLETLNNSNPNFISVYNLVVKETLRGTYSYITEYRFTNDWLQTQTGAVNWSTYTGEILFFTDQGHYVSTGEVNNGLGSQMDLLDPCETNGDGTGGSDNDGDNGTNGDGSTGDGSNGDSSNGDGSDGDGDGTSGDDEPVGESCTFDVYDTPPGDCTCAPFVIINCPGDKSQGIRSLSEVLRDPNCVDVDPCDGQNDCLGDMSPEDCSCLPEDEEEIENDEVGVNVDISYLILFDDTWTDYPCQKNIVAGSYQVSSPITQLFQDIFGDNPNNDVIFSADYDSINFGATYTPGTGNWAITFGQPFLDGSDLLMSVVTIHEIFHANLEFLYENLNTDSNPNNDIIINGNPINPSYGQLIDAWANNNTDGSESEQHNYIASYKDDIALATYNWAVTPLPDGGGYDSTDSTLLSYIENLSWIGLKNTDLWQSISNNPDNSQLVQDINQIIDNEIYPNAPTSNPKGNDCY